MKTQFGIKKWSNLQRERVYVWAGHISRMGQYDNDRLTYRLLQHRSVESIRRTMLRQEGDQLRGRRLRVWRWESADPLVGSGV